MELDKNVMNDILRLYQELQADGNLTSDSKLDEYYQKFRQRFGIDQLRRLDDKNLLEIMHSGNRDSLVYWLEFKNDEEFQTQCFGSIAGGSAHKFGIYRRVETGDWMLGTPQQQREVSVDEAIAVARKHLDQLEKGVELLASLSDGASDEDYVRLQAAMDTEASDVSRTAWGHKYFSLMFPDKLDCYHNMSWQQFHLIKMLIAPFESESRIPVTLTDRKGTEQTVNVNARTGRYLHAGKFVRVAAELGIRMNHLVSVLNRRNGQPYNYWCIDASDGENSRKRWDAMREGNYVALGWQKLGKLSFEPSTRKEHVIELLNQHYPENSPSVQERIADCFLNFITRATDGDIVLSCDGATVLGIGRRSKQQVSYIVSHNRRNRT